MGKKGTMGLALLVVNCFMLGNIATAFAGDWAADHPRRAQVNQRLRNQNNRIRQEVKEGDLNKAQAGQLHHEDHMIRQEERDMAKVNGGYITKQQQGALNQQLNKVSGRIGQ